MSNSNKNQSRIAEGVMRNNRSTERQRQVEKEKVFFKNIRESVKNNVFSNPKTKDIWRKVTSSWLKEK